MDVFLQIRAVPAQLSCRQTEATRLHRDQPTLVLEPACSLCSPGSAARYGGNVPFSSSD